MKRILLTFTLLLAIAVGTKAQHLAHIVQADSTITVQLNDVQDMTVVIDDYVPYAKGVYTSQFFKQSWEATLEYSQYNDTFRFKDCWVAGYDVTFKVTDWETMAFEMTSSAFTSGYIHPSYGMVTAKVFAAYNQFDPESNTFYFAYQWSVSAGTFGAYYDTFQITEIFNNNENSQAESSGPARANAVKKALNTNAKFTPTKNDGKIHSIKLAPTNEKALIIK